LRARRKGLLGGAVVLSALAIVAAAAPGAVFGADHADAPGTLQSPSNRPDADINDVYIFKSTRPGFTAIAMTTHPAVGVLSPRAYATDVTYKINIDRDSTNTATRALALRFKAPGPDGSQEYTATYYRQRNAETLREGEVVARGRTGQTVSGDDGMRVFAGLRSDPFFFDLDAFKHVVLGASNGRTGFCDAGTTDFFKNFNTNAIVVEIKSEELSNHVGVWGSTIGRNGVIDQVGRPAINTVFNHGDEKNLFNHTPPVDQFKSPFNMNVINAFMSLGHYSLADATKYAHVLLPDILTYDTRTQASGPLNGRGLRDDVIDAELSLVTNGGIKTDCVGPHHDYLSSFPYLGNPHSS
jgi:hypothetical protein